MPTLRHCNSGKIYYSLAQDNTLPYLYMLFRNHNNTCAVKSENLHLDVSYSMVVPSGGAEKKLSMGAELHTISYLTPKTF